ncbi:MAG: triose-phosphate isomerase [Alphaproteobacteria bacterium]|nr:triose-phosphate isomerase [Alphaproteobacteria bacterium]
MRQLIAGNWKMNGLGAQLGEIESIAANAPAHADLLICPPATLIARAAEAAKGRIAIGGQDCHAEISGAFTGDVSAEMLKDAGARFVIVGHSERRQYHGESDAAVAAKATAAWRADLTAIICVGETEAEREAGRALDVVGVQLAGSVPSGAPIEATVVAYEPVWAIGTGKVPTNGDIVQMHGHIRARLVAQLGEGARKVPILYGGSVKPSNAAEILALAEVGGALVGGASLKAADFGAIFSAARKD